jgi:hypothetical protein
VIFNGELFESPNYCSTLRQAEHVAAEVALNILSRRSSSQPLAARFFVTGLFILSAWWFSFVFFAALNSFLYWKLHKVKVGLMCDGECRMKQGSAKTCCRRQLKGLVCHYLHYYSIWTWASACLHMLGGGSRHDFLRRGCQNQEASREKRCHGSLVSSEAM